MLCESKFNTVVVLQNICNIIFWKLCYSIKKLTLNAWEVFKREQRIKFAAPLRFLGIELNEEMQPQIIVWQPNL